MAGVRAAHLVRLELWLDKTQKALLIARARAEDTTAQAIVRRAIERELAEMGERERPEEEGPKNGG